MLQPFLPLWSNSQKLESINMFISTWHKATHMINYTEQCLEHIDFPYNMWDAWWKFSFQSKFAKYNTKTFWTIKRVGQDKFKYQDPEFYYILFDESENGPFEVPSGCKKTHDKNQYLVILSYMFYRVNNVWNT